MKSYSNYLIIKTDTLFNDKAEYKGIDGKDLVLDPSFDPAKHVRTYGEVVSTPLYLTKSPVTQEHRGSPGYHEESPFEYRFLSDIEPEIQVGDRIYFHFHTISAANLVKVEGTHPNRVWYYKVSYEQVICFVRDGVITPVGSFVLCDPDFEEWKDILLPVRSNLKGPDGQFLMKPESEWIQTKLAPEYKYLTAYVRFLGKPFKGDKQEIAVGDKIWYRRNADWTNKIEGKDYFAIRQRHISGKEVDGKFVPIRGHMLVTPELEPDKTAGGVIIKRRLTRRGVVFAPGESRYKEGERIEFGESDRQELNLKEEKYLLIKRGDVLGVYN